MSTILSELSSCMKFGLHSLQGGTKHNAIPREAKAELVFLSEEDAAAAQQIVTRLQGLYAQAYQDSDPGVLIDIQPCGVEYKVKNGHLQVLAEADMQALIQLLAILPTGVQEMSQTIAGLPETSLNLAIVQMQSDELYVELSNRSSNPAALHLLEQRLAYLASICGFVCQTQSRYPGWQYRKDSKLRKTMIEVYERMYRKPPVVEVIHAGLECGILLSKMPELDIVSTGPDILDIHTPQERMRIASVQRTYAYVLEILAYNK